MYFNKTLLGILPLLLAVQAQATDFTKFIAERDFFITDGESVKTRKIGDHAFEQYSAGDSYGNRFHVRLREPALNQREVSASILWELLGLPNAPVYPILVRREKVWVIGTLQSQLNLTEPNWSKLSAEQLSELVAVVLLNGVLGIPSRFGTSDTDGTIAFVTNPTGGGHFLPFGGTHLFERDPGVNGSKVAESLKEFLNSVPVRKIHELSETELELFSSRLSQTLDRLEAIQDKHAHLIFGKSFALEKFVSARSALITALTKLGAPNTTLDKLKTKHAAPPSALNLPDRSGTSAQTPTEKMWQFFFQGVPSDLPEEEWKGMFEVASKDQTRMDYVGPHLQFALDSENSEGFGDLVQEALNPLNRETLVVVPLNDPEANEIARITKIAGAQLMAVNLPHGSKLDRDLKADILERAAQLKVKRVAVVELPGEPLVLESDIQKAGYAFFPIDHHNYPGSNLDRFQRLSSLEQSAKLLGFKLSPRSKVIAVNDRSFIYGLRDLGISKEMLTANANAMGIRSYPLPNSYVEGNTEWGNLLILPAVYAKIGTIAGGLAYDRYPEVINVLVVDGDGLRFSGSPAFVSKLSEIVKTYEAKMLANYGEKLVHYSGGDSARSMFWGIKSVPGGILSDIKRDVEALLLRTSTRDGCSGYLKP